MRTRRARQIRAGIRIARMAPADIAWTLTFDRHTRLTIRAYRRESVNVFKRFLRHHCISSAELQPPLELADWKNQPWSEPNLCAP